MPGHDLPVKSFLGVRGRTEAGCIQLSRLWKEFGKNIIQVGEPVVLTKKPVFRLCLNDNEECMCGKLSLT